MPEAPGIRGLPAGSDLSKTIDKEAIVSLGPQSLPSSIGPYRIIECIGEGGMGVVYRAEQREPVRRIVALKVIKLGMDTKEVVARFEAERQALALMSHPNVAKVFDAGITETGRPYFAMEHVPGVSITSYCDTHKLTTKERLELFIPVCHAVQHAHQKGIIHRDLKPGNVLVTMFDGKPVPKVIDFGVAKATNFNLTDKTLFTHLGSVVGTIEYMSPEQATSSGLDVDTRTDVYSLGVILYQLLTGTLPFESETLRKAGVEARAKIILDTDPPKPSSRLTASRRAPVHRRWPDSAQIAKLHRTDPRGLRRELRGDLDWIILKAIEKDRTRRYETANALVMDVRRHLDNEPVSARPPSTAYRIAKFTRRHRVGVLAAAAIAIALLAGFTASTIGFVRALHATAETERQRRIAVAEATLARQKEQEADQSARRAERVSAFVQDVLSVFGAEGIRRTPTQTLDEVARRIQLDGIGGGLAEEEAGIRAILARRYVALGLYQRAMPQFEAVLRLNRQNGLKGQGLLSSLNELADALVTDGDFGEAGPITSEALDIQQHTNGLDDASIALTLNLRGSVLAGLGKWDEAEPIFRRAWDMRQRSHGDSRWLADSLADEGEIRLRHHDFTGNALMEQALEMYERIFVAQSAAIVGPLRRMARRAAQRGEWAEANQRLTQAHSLDIGLVRDQLQVANALLQSKPDDPTLLQERSGYYGKMGQFDRALSDFARLITLKPTDPLAWQQSLPLLLLFNKVSLYQQRRHEALVRFKTTDSVQTMHLIAKSSLCFPIEDEDLTLANQMADDAFQSNPAFQFFQQSKGMAEYRAGRFADAIKWLIKSRDHVYPSRDIIADFYIAMAYFKLGDKTQARSYFDSGVQTWNAFAPKAGSDALDQFKDWVLCILARNEAEQLITGKPSPPVWP